MSTYTTNSKTSGEIYFLNDNNIAFGKNDMSCAAGFNAVASQEEFVEAYDELGKVSSDLYALSGKTETSAAILDGKIDDVSAAIDIKFLPLSGGAIDGSLSVQGSLSVGGLLDTKYIKTDDDGKITVTGNGAERHGGIDMRFEHGLNDISVNGASLSSYIRDSINELDVETISADQGQILSEISQHDGRISANMRNLVSADIPNLPASKITGLKDYAEKVADSRISAFSLSNDNGRHALWLINRDVGLNISVDTDEFVKDGMISSVSYNISGDAQHNNPPYVVITWNTDSGKIGDDQQSWLPIKEFANVYSTKDPGIDVDKLKHFEFALDYRHIACLSDVQGLRFDISALQTYATELSAPVVGTIAVLSAGVDRALSSNIRTVKFIGHVELNDEVSSKTFADLLNKYGNLDEENRILNGAMIEVKASVTDRRYVTSDGLALGDGDYVYVHKHGMDTYVQKDDIRESSYLANPVHKYDVADLRQFVVDNFVKLSGGNEISGNNAFLGDLSAGQNLSVGQDLSVSGVATVKILNVLEDGTVSGNLGVSGNAEFGGDFGVLDGNASFGGDLSVDFTRLYDPSGNSLADICADLSCTISGLSGEVSAISSDLRAEISARAMLSVDDEPVQEFRFLHISQDNYHDLVLSVDGKTTDPNTLYVVSSENMCMYDRKITDLAEGELSGDACTYGQLSAFKAQIKSAIDKALPEDTFEDNLTVQLSVIVKCLFDIKTALA